MAEAKLRAKLVMCNVPSTDFAKTRRFYSVLLGSDDFVRGPNRAVESYSRPLSNDGVDLAITERYDDREGFTCYFAVDNLDRSMEELQELGGTLVSEPIDIPSPDKESQFGRMVVMLDPSGNHLGLIELGESGHRHFRFGEFRRPLEEDQIEDLELARELEKEFFGR